MRQSLLLMRAGKQNSSMVGMTASAHPTAHEQLRSSTRDLHQLVDSRFDLASISSEATYAAFLLASWPFASIEVALEGAGIQKVLPDWPKRRRRDALADDIKQCGISLPSIGRLEIGSDHGVLLGWSYVLEGSRLGAGMILNAIQRPCEQGARGTRFLHHGAGEHLWRDFKIALSKIDRDPPAISNACEGARLAFHCFLAATGP
jgi:heme oxygenase (biliverdin-IX-beta and delta-forming)